ncbi:hypothetical protein L5515_019236 [Caenorhabditis briggsae]|uniref:Uncharacterized protein n=1 Tax=Caenorhabditis briggsae TaxID=6238 RepID=A0AAE9FL93_CAEBR|nr:hypothetical protein L5515_019236 [Caenorhabditis briggsae]
MVDDDPCLNSDLKNRTEPGVQIVQDGSHYLRELESFDGLTLFRKVKGFGLEVLEKIVIENLEKYLKDQKYLNVICSFTQITKAMQVKKFLEIFKKDSGNDNEYHFLRGVKAEEVSFFFIL